MTPWYHLTSQAVCLCAHAPITVGIRPLLLREDPRSEKRLAGELQPLGPFGELTPTAPSLYVQTRLLPGHCHGHASKCLCNLEFLTS